MHPVSVGTPLKNGLRFYAHGDRVSRLAGVGITCGSIHDPKNKRGFWHLWEHVATQRTVDLDFYQTQLLFWKCMGGPDKDRNIHTRRVGVFFGHGDLYWKRHMLELFPVFASMIKKPVFSQNDLVAETAAVREEYFLRGIDWMPELIGDMMHEAMYEKNPARNRIDCDPEELLSITLRDLERFQRNVVPNSMFVLLLGPSFEEAKKLVLKNFGDLAPGSPPLLAYDHSEDFPTLPSIKLVEVARRGIHQHHIAIGFPTETYLTKDAEALDVLAQILEFRLCLRLRKNTTDPKKGVYRAEVFTPRTFVHGIFYIYFAASDREFAQECVNRILQEISTLRKEFVPAQELKSMQEHMDAEYREAFRDRAEALTDLIIDAVCNGDEELQHMHSFLSRLHRVTRSKIRDVANKYLTPDRFVEVAIRPE